MADAQGEALLAGRTLKGDIFMGTHTDPSDVMNPLDYLLAFPNPAKEELHLRFVLNERSHVIAEAYDANGRLARQLFNGVLMPAEHNLPVNLSGWQEGLYVIKFNLDNSEILYRKVIVL